MNLLVVVSATGLACWGAWLELAARTPDLATALPLFLVALALATPCLLRVRALRPVRPAPLTLWLLGYAAAVVLAPPLVRIAPAVLAMAYCLHSAVHRGAPGLAFHGLVLLALPVLPSLEFYAAYPVRLVAIEISAALLRMNGLAVGTQGLALQFGGELVQFDAPCSGVHMLWTCWFLASAIAWLYGWPWWRYALALALASGLAIAGNILRATSLFYLETKLLAIGTGAWLHQAVGVAAFCLTALAVCAALCFRPRVPGVRA
jgi:exosortase/archaeosortase family protein